MVLPGAAALGLLWLALCAVLAGAIELDVNNPDSIKAAASTIARGIITDYYGSPEYPGLFPYPPYYWWESGAVWAGMVDYYAYTEDSTFLSTTTEALLSQVGPDNNYIVPAHRFDEGNDDQAFWGLGLMSALETQLPPNPSFPAPDWLTLLTRLFNNQTGRWDTTSCNGGLKWQIYPENAYGYDYKNSVSNGAYFQLAARLARYTGQQMYADLATRTWEWCIDIGLIGPAYDVYDGADDTLNCSQLDHTQWTYNVAIFLEGAAAMYSFSNDSLWADRVDGLLGAASVFFSPFPNATDIMFEAACETYGKCDVDQYSFKGYLSRWLAKTMVLAPWTRPTILPWLQASALGAARSCSGGKDGVMCGYKWYTEGWDGNAGLGQQLSALETIQSLLVAQAGVPYSLGVPKAAPAVLATVPVAVDTATVRKREVVNGTTVDAGGHGPVVTSLPVSGAEALMVAVLMPLVLMAVLATRVL